MSQSKQQSEPTKIEGIDFNKDFDLQTLLSSFQGMGGQGSQLFQATELLKKIIKLRSEPDPTKRPVVLLGYTSNMISCGIREVIRYLTKHNLVDAIVTTGGGIEEDFMKCFKDSFVIDYVVDDRKMRTEGKNRIGNMVVSNQSYVQFEAWLTPLLGELSNRQNETGQLVGPSDIIAKMAENIKNEESVYHWCHVNNIPVFCPGITDGAVGDIVYFNRFKDDTFIIDLNSDLRKIVDIAKQGRPLATIVLGGGIVRYHVTNACKIGGGGLDYGIFVTSAPDYDCSNSGSLPEQEKTRGAAKKDAEMVMVNGEASVIFTMMMAGAVGKMDD